MNTKPHHDTNDKQLSHHFNNVIVSNNEENEYEDYITIIFQQKPQILFAENCTDIL